MRHSNRGKRVDCLFHSQEAQSDASRRFLDLVTNWGTPVISGVAGLAEEEIEALSVSPSTQGQKQALLAGGISRVNTDPAPTDSTYAYYSRPFASEERPAKRRLSASDIGADSECAR